MALARLRVTADDGILCRRDVPGRRNVRAAGSLCRRCARWPQWTGNSHSGPRDIAINRNWGISVEPASSHTEDDRFSRRSTHVATDRLPASANGYGSRSGKVNVKPGV